MYILPSLTVLVPKAGSAHKFTSLALGKESLSRSPDNYLPFKKLCKNRLVMPVAAIAIIVDDGWIGWSCPWNVSGHRGPWPESREVLHRGGLCYGVDPQYILCYWKEMSLIPSSFYSQHHCCWTWPLGWRWACGVIGVFKATATAGLNSPVSWPWTHWPE